MNRIISVFATVLIFLSIPSKGRAQAAVADSLMSLLKNPSLHDTAKIKLYGDISWELNGSNINLALDYAWLELKLSEKLARKGDMAQAESDIGNIYNRKAIYDTALVHYNRALALRTELKQDEKVANVLNNMATVYMRQSNFKQSLEINFKALKVYEKLDSKAKQANILSNIGNLYRELEQKVTAATYYRRALSLAKELKLDVIEGRVLVNLGAFKMEAFDRDTTGSKELDSALYFFLEADKLLANKNDLYNLGVLYNNLGRVYARKQEVKQAIVYFEKSLTIREKLEDRYGMGLSAIALGELYYLQKDYPNCIRYLNQSVETFKALRNFVDLKQAYDKLAAAYQAQGKYSEALKYQKLYAMYNDSVYNAENARQMAEMQTKYESEKKDLELLKNKAELKIKEEQSFIKSIVIVAVIFLLVFISIIGYLFYRKKQIQQKAELDAELATQKNLRSRAVIEAEEKERIRIAKDLHDGVGQLLSAAKLNLSSIENQIKKDDTVQQSAFKNALELLDDSVKEVRTVSHNMMPNTLLKSGLPSAVKEFISKIQNPNLKVNLEIVGMDERIAQEKESILYRVIQEIVSNIIKHAKATELTLQLISHENELSILIQDNGVGFDTAKMEDFEGIGLKNIISRVEFINGTVHFDSAKNRGTTVIIDVVTS